MIAFLCIAMNMKQSPFHELHITPPDVVDQIKKAPIPQIIFMATYSHLIHGKHAFYTDASKTDSVSFVGFGFYYSTLNIQRLSKIDGFASVFMGETLAVIKCVDFISANKISDLSSLQSHVVL